jgi:hypothetical protein
LFAEGNETRNYSRQDRQDGQEESGKFRIPDFS